MLTGAGNDNIRVSSGQNNITTANGADVLSFSMAKPNKHRDGDDEVTVTEANSVGTGASNDTVTFLAVATLKFWNGNDIVASSAGNNT